LRASFPLPGMVAHGDETEELPALTLDLMSSGELENLWSGPDGPPIWRGRLGDGVDLTIEQGAREDLRYAYGDRARLRLDPEREVLACAPLQAGLDWQRALIGKVLASVSVICGYE